MIDKKIIDLVRKAHKKITHLKKRKKALEQAISRLNIDDHPYKFDSEGKILSPEQEDNERRVYLNNQMNGLEAPKDPLYSRTEAAFDPHRILSGKYEVLRTLATRGDPLAIKVLEHPLIKDEFNVDSRLVSNILTRRMTEEEYNGFLNGKYAVGICWGSLIFLNP